MGFSTHIHVFGWEKSGQHFDTALAGLVALIDALPGKVSVIGASAGGTAAIHALAARPDKVGRVVTISTPYETAPTIRSNILLGESLSRLPAALHSLAPPRVESVYGLAGVDITRACRNTAYDAEKIFAFYVT